jgi:hypothetical protein
MMWNRTIAQTRRKSVALALISLVACLFLDCRNRALPSGPDLAGSSPANAVENPDIERGSTHTAKGIDAKVGLVSSMKDGHGCVRGLNAGLRPGAEIYLITPYAGEVEIAMVKAASEYQMLSGFVILDPAISPSLEKGIPTAELTGAPPPEYFRECTSNEGMHFTVWTGKPLVGKRIWHRYWYLHYDTKFTCKKKDYERTE